jgi:hypothetical protein
LQIIWRKTLHAIWRTLRVWTNWRGITEEARKLAFDRFRLLQPHLEDDRPLKAVAAAGIPFRTAQRWVSLYRQFGLGALARKKRTDNGQHREISARLEEAIEGIALQKPPVKFFARTKGAFGVVAFLRKARESRVWRRLAVLAALEKLPATAGMSSFQQYSGGG